MSKMTSTKRNAQRVVIKDHTFSLSHCYTEYIDEGYQKIRLKLVIDDRNYWLELDKNDRAFLYRATRTQEIEL